MPEDAREALAAHLGVEDETLRHPEVPPRKTVTRVKRHKGGVYGFPTLI